MQAFLARQRPGDRILLVGDIHQHEAVDAGTPFKQLQQAGIGVTTLEEIVRQKNPEVKAIVERLANGGVRRRSRWPRPRAACTHRRWAPAIGDHARTI